MSVWIVSTILLALLSGVLALVVWNMKRKFHIRGPLVFNGAIGDKLAIDTNNKNDQATGYMCYPRVIVSCGALKEGVPINRYNTSARFTTSPPANQFENWTNPGRVEFQ